MCFTCTSNKRIHIEKLKREREKHVICAQKLGCAPKREKDKLYHGALLSQLVAKVVDCWSKYLQERDICQKKRKNKEKAVGKEVTKRN